MGINIFFTTPQTGEMQMIHDGGFRWVRKDFDWASTETSPGVYNFSAYDPLFTSLGTYGMRALLILDYTNPLYDNNQFPTSPTAVNAFANWARAAVAHFQGKGVMWELWNEPDGSGISADEFANLATTVGAAIKGTYPNELYVGPALAGFDGWGAFNLPWITTTIQDGVLNYWDAITVHPYRQVAPDDPTGDYVVNDYARLSTAISQFKSGVPILAGEFGYSTNWTGFDVNKTAKYVSRFWLTNYSYGIPLQMTFDWADGCTDPYNSGCNFSIVYNGYQNPTQPYLTKPAYQAAQTLNNQLGGYSFSSRLSQGTSNDWVLAFSNGSSTRYAAWDLNGADDAVTIPASANAAVTVTNYTGTWVGHFTAGATGGFYMGLTDEPEYVVVTGAANSPSAPTRLAASPGNTNAILSWTGSSGATYNIYRGTAAGSEATTAIATGISTTSYTNTGLTNGTSYFYKVAAVSASSTSSQSNEASAIPNGIIESTSVALTSSSVSNNNASITATVTYKNMTSSSLTLLNAGIAARDSSNNNKDFGYTGNVTLTPNQTVTISKTRTFTSSDASGAYTVFGAYETSDTVWHNISSPTLNLTVTPTPPSAPTGVGAAPNNAQITVYWAPIVGATTYNVYRGTAAGGESATPIATGITTSAYTNAGLTNGTTYYYKVAEVNAGGTSAMSSEATTTPYTPIVESTALALDKYTVSRNGGTVTGTVTLQNVSGSSITLSNIDIAARDQSNGNRDFGGPGTTTLAPGQTVTVSQIRYFTTSDPTGNWTVFLSYQTTDTVWHTLLPTLGLTVTN